MSWSDFLGILFKLLLLLLSAAAVLAFLAPILIACFKFVRWLLHDSLRVLWCAILSCAVLGIPIPAFRAVLLGVLAAVLFCLARFLFAFPRGDRRFLSAAVLALVAAMMGVVVVVRVLDVVGWRFAFDVALLAGFAALLVGLRIGLARQRLALPGMSIAVAVVAVCSSPFAWPFDHGLRTWIVTGIALASCGWIGVLLGLWNNRSQLVA